MGIIKLEDVLAWEHDGAIFCCSCGDQEGEAVPLTEGDFTNNDVVVCDGCHKKRIC